MTTIQRDRVRRDFVLYKREGNYRAVVQTLNHYLDSQQLPTDERAWALWNICDILAVHNFPHEQLPYHRQLFEFASKELPAEQFHWVVSDSTQSTALVDIGHLSEWVEWYHEANEKAPRTSGNRNIRFEAHRAAVSTSIYASECELGHASLQLITELLLEDPAWHNRDYALCNYHILRLEHDAVCGDGSAKSESMTCLREQLFDWLSRYPESVLKDDLYSPLLGTWEQLNYNHPPSVIRTLLWNGGCVACRLGEYQTFLDLYEKAIALGDTPNPYSKTLRIIALWNIHQDRDQIHRELHSSPELVTSELKRLAPELLELL